MNEKLCGYMIIFAFHRLVCHLGVISVATQTLTDHLHSDLNKKK